MLDKNKVDAFCVITDYIISYCRYSQKLIFESLNNEGTFIFIVKPEISFQCHLLEGVTINNDIYLLLYGEQEIAHFRLNKSLFDTVSETILEPKLLLSKCRNSPYLKCALISIDAFCFIATFSSNQNFYLINANHLSEPCLKENLLRDDLDKNFQKNTPQKFNIHEALGETYMDFSFSIKLGHFNIYFLNKLGAILALKIILNSSDLNVMKIIKKYYMPTMILKEEVEDFLSEYIKIQCIYSEYMEIILLCQTCEAESYNFKMRHLINLNTSNNDCLLFYNFETIKVYLHNLSNIIIKSWKFPISYELPNGYFIKFNREIMFININWIQDFNAFLRNLGLQNTLPIMTKLTNGLSKKTYIVQKMFKKSVLIPILIQKNLNNGSIFNFDFNIENNHKSTNLSFYWLENSHIEMKKINLLDSIWQNSLLFEGILDCLHDKDYTCDINAQKYLDIISEYFGMNKHMEKLNNANLMLFNSSFNKNLIDPHNDLTDFNFQAYQHLNELYSNLISKKEKLTITYDNQTKKQNELENSLSSLQINVHADQVKWKDLKKKIIEIKGRVNILKKDSLSRNFDQLHGAEKEKIQKMLNSLSLKISQKLRPALNEVQNMGVQLDIAQLQAQTTCTNQSTQVSTEQDDLVNLDIKSIVDHQNTQIEDLRARLINLVNNNVDIPFTGH